MSPVAIVLIALCVAGLLAFVIQQVMRIYRRQASVGREEMVGKTAVVKVALDPEGMVLFKGERWAAASEKGRVKPGEEVIITKVDGLKLWVVKKA
jgi:membrane-bound ClpP family serine protease